MATKKKVTVVESAPAAAAVPAAPSVPAPAPAEREVNVVFVKKAEPETVIVPRSAATNPETNPERRQGQAPSTTTNEET